MIKNKRKLELYFHIPFCVRKCKYCDFLSGPADATTIDAYMEAIIKETECKAASFREYFVDTIFIGGGTPSVVDQKWICRLLNRVYELYKVSEDAEITIEINPGTADENKLRSYHKAGINRLSIGLQSANDKELELLGRIHRYDEFEKLYFLARKVGFNNINIDIMSALPGQRFEDYKYTLDKAIELDPEHISSYSLIIEEGTPFYEGVNNGSLKPVDEDLDREMYSYTKQRLRTAGFDRYEISNYSKPGYECRHNTGYWTRVEYAGFGIGAASLVDEKRYSNTRKIKKYISNPVCSPENEEILGRNDRMEEFMFLGLRLARGVSLGTFASLFGCSINEVYKGVVDRNIKDGLLYFKEDSGDMYVALTDRGMDVSNYVFSQFIL